ncbi:MAG: hypothetical protein U9O95_07370 [Candidatus Marinimicrobia bacterium]|nr:hypothetical protein [Candidatus Neomarinimicrobiota bacterium]
MKILKKLIISLFIVTLMFAQSGPEYRRSAVHNANLVRTVFGNWGVVGQPTGKGPRGAWLFDTNGYIGDISPMVGAEVSYHDSEYDTTYTFNSVVVCPVDRPRSEEESSSDGKLWTFEPVGGYINANQTSIAISTNPNSWPVTWPDKMTDTEDSGWRNSWNGYFGKGVFSADQESYYVMDDNNDEEYNYRSNTAGRTTGFPGYEFKPDANDATRNGLGLEVKVRGMQWQQFLASDVIFWLYEVTNTSTTDYNKVTFGMLCGTYLGVTSVEDYGEYDDDWSFFDVENDITYTGDFDNSCRRNPKWQGPVGLVGYAFLESPGNQYDGIDNDADNNVETYPALTFTAPLFTEADFDTLVYDIGDEVVVIDNDYNRSTVTITTDPQVIVTRGMTVTIVPGVTKFIEGNTIDEFYNVNQNVYDGIDNDLDGLIDENYIYHYRQIRMKQEADKYDIDKDGDRDEIINVVLYDELNPVSYIDYINGFGMDDPMIDEKRADGIDNDGDWNMDFDDVGADGKDNTNDFGEGDGLPTAGEPNFDATDVDESDQIGLSSFNYFTPSNEYPMDDDDLLWEWMKPGYFDLPTNIQGGEPVAGEDGDFIYGSGYFPLRAGETQRFSLALVYGHDMDDLYKNRQTVQKIYNSDYRFPSAPDKPTLTAVPGDEKVTLYWDRAAEKSIDPVTKEKDFEGYKIYKATDPDFNELYTVTNANGVVTGYKALEQFDIVNDIEGLFEAKSELFQEADGYTVNLGSNTGLQHSYIDNNVINGKQYYYAVVAYDRGDPNADIYPSENTKFISVQADGTIITDINTAVVRPQPTTAGYDPLNASTLLFHDEGPASGGISYNILNETLLTDHTYRLTFTDTKYDSIDNNDNDTLDLKDPEEFSPSTTTYTVMDITGHSETLEIDTAYIYLEKKDLIGSSILMAEADYPDDYIDITEFEIDTVRGRIKLINGSAYDKGDYVLNYQYYPVYQSPNIYGSPFSDETKDSDIFDGIELVFDNDWTIKKDETATFWNTEGDRFMDFSMRAFTSSFGARNMTGIPYPADYELRFTDSTVIGYLTPGTLITNVYSSLPSFLRPQPVKTNFYLYNMTDSLVVPFIFSGGTKNDADIYELSNGAMISTFFYLPDDADSLNAYYSWVINFRDQTAIRPRFGDGDILNIITKKPFRKGDVFEFTSEIPEIDTDLATNSLDDIQVVPNPYIVANNMEAPLPPAVTSGRGERRIEFRKLPTDAKVYIFTSAGSLVRTLNHNGDIHNGTLAWDLKSSENLDVAFGVFFYVIESEAGKKSGKVAVIK